MGPMWRYLRLARPHFLLGGALLYALGARFAASIDVGRYTLGQALVTTVQLTAHLVNEHYDAEVDRFVHNRTYFSGGSGVIPSGQLPRRSAFVGAVAASALALAGVAATVAISPLAAALGAIALIVAWSYSAPPMRLLGTGWGELVTSVVVAGLVPLTGAAAQSAALGGFGLATIAALVPLHVAMMLCFELPDVEGDAAAGKRVLAVRLGPAAAIRLIALAATASGATLLVIGLLRGSLFPAIAAAGVELLAAGVVISSVRRGWWPGVTGGAAFGFLAVAAAAMAGI